MHPTETRFWIMASQWESDGDHKGMGGGNTEGASRLCMRALRFLKGRNNSERDVEAVWREWIRVEVGFVERLRERWHVLGIGKGGSEEIVRVGRGGEKGKQTSEGEEEDDDPEEEADEIALPGAEADESRLKEEVDEQAVSGQEALLNGAIVRVVLDNLLKCTFPAARLPPSRPVLTPHLSTAYSHSIDAYKLVLSILGPLASPLRSPLLTHVYASLRAHILPSTPAYPAALHLLATRHLYDVAYVPPKKQKNGRKREAEEMQAAGGREAEGDPFAIRVEGERLVDAVGKACDEYWTALRTSGARVGKKGKGKEREAGAQEQEMWEQFCAWLEEMAESVEKEDDLVSFISMGLLRWFPR